MNLPKAVAKQLLPKRFYDAAARGYRSYKNPTPKITPLHKLVSINQTENLRWFEMIQKYLQVNRIDGVYAEFGCHEVNTFRFALNTIGRYNMPNKISHFYAFDSFAGMPDPVGIDRQKIWRKGMNFTSEERFREVCALDLHRITTCKGFFEDSLPKFKWNPEHRIALAYLDVDFYSSTKECIEFIGDKLQHGAVVAFDDWNCYYADSKRGQRLAFTEWSKALEGKAKLEPLLPISWGGMSFVYQELDKLGKEIL